MRWQMFVIFVTGKYLEQPKSLRLGQGRWFHLMTERARLTVRNFKVINWMRRNKQHAHEWYNQSINLHSGDRMATMWQFVKVKVWNNSRLKLFSSLGAFEYSITLFLRPPFPPSCHILCSIQFLRHFLLFKKIAGSQNGFINGVPKL